VPAAKSRSGKTLDECGKLLGLSRERVRQLERDAIAKMRASLEERGLSFEDLFSARRGGDDAAARLAGRDE
jgi:DNA-directed RNA polymerase sigma subunit (sigma70/sigma32)